MFKTLANIFRIPELRNKVLFTLTLLCVYRVGYYVPLPGIDAPALAAQAKENASSALGAVSQYLQLFSGGTLSQSTIFALGIMPFISASIILQLLGSVVPALEKLRREGEPGMRKLNEWTRYLTVIVCIIQAIMWVSSISGQLGGHLLYPIVREYPYFQLFMITAVVVLTTGAVFLMWLGEQIDHYGIGNGVSLIITAGIISRMPNAIIELYTGSPLRGSVETITDGIWGGMSRLFHAQGGSGWSYFIDRGAAALHDIKINLANTSSEIKYSLPKIGFVLVAFVFVVAGCILLTQAQRRIRVQQAKHMRGRKVYGGQSQYLPLRVNHAGVMPIIFAQSLMVFPQMIAGYFANRPNADSIARFFGRYIQMGEFPYELGYIGMVFFFSYFWNTVQFQPKEMANQLRDYGSFVPGLRPGKRTAEYLENVMTRITYVGAGFLAVIAVVPTVVGNGLLDMRSNPQAYMIVNFLGGTGLLIVIQVMLDLINRIEANLVMRNYGGFLEGSSSNNRLKDRVRAGRGPSPTAQRENDPNARQLPA